MTYSLRSLDTTSSAWDFENRLTSVTLPGTGGTVSFKYDPFGRRIQKISPNGTTNYLYDGTNVVEERNETGAVTARYVQGEGIDEPLALSASAVYFYQADGLGSITSLTDSTGTAAATYVYDAFGNPTASTGTVANAYRYTAREYDPETGLYYYRARYYATMIGRFTSEDPIQFQGGSDVYIYGANNPTLYTDPNGLWPGQCTYYLSKCAQTGLECRASLDRASGNSELNLCQGTRSNNPDDAYLKTCFLGNYYCQRAVETCGQDAVTPPFKQAKMGNGPPRNIGATTDPPTPVRFPPNYPGKP